MVIRFCPKHCFYICDIFYGVIYCHIIVHGHIIVSFDSNVFNHLLFEYFGYSVCGLVADCISI